MVDIKTIKEIEQKIVDSLMKESQIESFCTAQTESNIGTFTKDKLDDALNELQKIEEEFYVNIFKKQGFDPDIDILVIGKKIAEVLNIKQQLLPERFKGRVTFSSFDPHNIYFIKPSGIPFCVSGDFT